jgi:hypothetical protein
MEEVAVFCLIILHKLLLLTSLEHSIVIFKN